MTAAHRTNAAHWNQRGFTLIELMIASAIALAMLIGVANLYLSSLTTEKTNNQASEVTTNGRYAMDVLRRDLLHAAYRGVSWAAPSAISTAVGSIANECIGSGFATNIRQGIWGSNDSNPFSATCIPAANYRAGDTLVIRGAALSTTATASLVGTTLYFRSAYERGEVFQGSQSTALATTFTQTPNYNYALRANIYYISPYTTSATESPLVPALYRVVLGDGPAMSTELVASNIENMQIRYGRYTTDQNTQFYDADGVSATATATTTTTTEWDAVNSARIWLLVRSTRPEAGYTNTSTYTLGDVTVTVNDGYRREVFSTVVQLRNI
jgi:type IV pilus assembly protein PilW